MFVLNWSQTKSVKIEKEVEQLINEEQMAKGEGKPMKSQSY